MTGISICMPYFNRMGPLKKTLRTYQNNEYFNGSHGIDVSVSLCDDGSKKEPVSALDNYGWLKKTYLPKKDDWRCACTPLNRAVKMADSEHILLTSPEVYHPRPVLSKMFSLMSGTRDIVLACVKAEGRDTRMKQWKGWYSHPEHRPIKFWWCQLMRKSLFNEIGGFDEGYRKGRGWEDTDFVERMDIAGANWIWATDCVVVHPFFNHKPKIKNNPNPGRFKDTHGKYSNKFI